MTFLIRHAALALHDQTMRLFVPCEYGTVPSFRFSGEGEDDLASFVPSLPKTDLGVIVCYLPTTEPNMSLRSDCCLVHPSRTWLLLSALILLLWSPFTIAFGVSGSVLKSRDEVIGSRRHLIPVAETTAVVAEATAAVAEHNFWHVLAVRAVVDLCLYLFGSFLGSCRNYFTTTPSSDEIRSEIHETNKGLEGMKTKLAKLQTKLQRLHPKTK
jgi:hypothetical protein